MNTCSLCKVYFLFYEGNVYKSYGQFKFNNSLKPNRKSLKINGIAMNKNQYSKILIKYGLSVFAENIANPKKLNIRNLEKIYKR